jgi:hypothetical protein
MSWGSGPGIGFMTVLGYLSFLIGAVLVWQGRNNIYVWVHDEFGAFRRSLSRYTPIGPFYGPREESRLKVVPSQMVRTLSAIPKSRYSYGAFLLFLGPLLILLDLFL